MNANAIAPLPVQTASRVDLASMVEILQSQHRQKVDVVVPLSSVRLNGGAFEVNGLDPVVSDSGVTDINGLYAGTMRSDGDLATMLGIPVKYVRRLRAEHVGLLDTNVNEWAGRDERSVLLRLFYGTTEDHPEIVGQARAVLSDRYGIQDNLDVVLSALDGMRAAGLGADNISSLSLSHDKLYMFVEAPEISVMAPKLLEGYRSPWNGRTGETLPIVHAGFVIQNSETGQGALSVVPRLVVRICTNGLTMTKDALRRVHLGGRMAEGQIRWQSDTVAQANDLIKLQMRDAVSQFLSEDYVAATVAKLEESSGVEVTDAPKTMEVVSKALSFTEAESTGILNHFIRGGQATSGGIMQAVTSFAQEVEDVDRSAELEAAGVDAMLAAAKVGG